MLPELVELPPAPELPPDCAPVLVLPPALEPSPPPLALEPSPAPKSALEALPELPLLPEVDPELPLSSPRLLALAAGAKVLAADVSVVFAVVDLEGTESAVALPSAKEPPDWRDSAARESEVMVPVPSSMTVLSLGACVRLLAVGCCLCVQDLPWCWQ